MAVFTPRPVSLSPAQAQQPGGCAAAPQPAGPALCSIAPGLLPGSAAWHGFHCPAPRQTADTGHLPAALPGRDLTCLPGSSESSPVLAAGCWLCCSSSLCLPICRLGAWRGTRRVLLQGLFVSLWGSLRAQPHWRGGNPAMILVSLRELFNICPSLRLPRAVELPRSCVFTL